MKRKSKCKKDLMKHCLKRLYSRYNIKGTQTDWEYMNGLIRKKMADFVLKESNTRTHWVIELKCKKIYVVYNKIHKSVATCLPKECIDSPELVEQHLLNRI